MKISIFGAGYVGLVAATGFADFGHTVCCGDVNEDLVSSLKAGKLHFFEPNLEELMARQVAAGRLSFSHDLNELTSFADVLVLAVGTPTLPSGDTDLDAVTSVATSIATNMKSDKVVVIKSTVPIGTCKSIEGLISRRLAENSRKLKVSVISNPEFLREGSAVADFQRPDRLIVGVEDPKDGALMKSLYAPILRDQVKIFEMSRESAELTKYASNAMLATRISFINEIALLAEKVGADVESVRAGIGSDSRIGPEFLSAGIGFGGSCFPKDLKALVKMGEQNSLAMHVIRATLEVNLNQRSVLVAKAIDHFGSLKGMKCAIWGLSFKPETDDLRYAPSIEIVDSLVAAGARVSAYDPAFRDASRFDEFTGGRFELCNTAYEAVADADMLFLVTEWREFMSPDFRRMSEVMSQPVIFDGRNIWNPQSLKSRGFTYFGIGR